MARKKLNPDEEMVEMEGVQSTSAEEQVFEIMDGLPSTTGTDLMGDSQDQSEVVEEDGVNVLEQTERSVQVPIFGAERRHPVGSRRLAVIAGKYGGGVFCNLPDGVVCMCNYAYQYEDADFEVGQNVVLMVQRYNNEKHQMYGKIVSKW